MGRLMAPENRVTFVVSTLADRSGEQDRKRQRSHVMRGKNRKKLPSRPQSWINGVDSEAAGAQPTVGDSIAIPQKLGGQFDLANLPLELTPEMQKSIWDFRNTVKLGMFPLELGPSSTKSEPQWFENMFHDPACLHAMAFSTKMYFDRARGLKEISTVTMNSFVELLNILQKRLASDDIDVLSSDSTIWVVMGLTTIATSLNEQASARNHIHGLQKLIMMRGGLGTFAGKMSLQSKICRADIGAALCTGDKPLFFSDAISWDSYLPPPQKKLIRAVGVDRDASPEMKNPCDNTLDYRLRLVWDDVSEFSRAINLATKCKLTVDAELYSEVMVSVHYRLMKLDFTLGTVDEIIRLGLLAFASSLYVQWRDVKMRFKHFASLLEDALVFLRGDSEIIPLGLKIWFYMVCLVSVLDENDELRFRPSLIEFLEAAGKASWREVKVGLKSILWVDALHDPPAQKIVEAARSTKVAQFKSEAL